MGPGLWLVTALGAGALLRRVPGRDYPGRAIALATSPEPAQTRSLSPRATLGLAV
jgi:hypothetical protein